MIKVFIFIPMFIAMVCSVVWSGKQTFAQSAQDRAFEAVENNEIIDYGLIRNQIEEKYSGKIIDVILITNEGDVLLYKLKVLQGMGRVLNILVNANSGEEVELQGG